MKLLFVCTVNQMRSATAHEIYRADPRFEVESAGTSELARQVLTPALLAWADAVVVMEKHHRQHIRRHFPDAYRQKRIVRLYLPDDYLYMEPQLIAALRERVEDVYRRGLLR
ncbi:protein tyrosine phosphatase [Hymenobacter sp. 15J16-1T3B]|uniref:low molecular weight protein tyrosine phosphatase family protein n=1 Tax=Hymenobacter sp. 15J16-1T3B TaxID=2886941 RepID=UPI001D118A00|nr:protein tyrosine phosphatase [Hymenobacter sp. 15J16-1T3B]MCC3157230.1 protein tyrosine phosphatase [Hymenobacter sp. 15J16-1T3B]